MTRDRRPIVVLLVDDQPFIGTAVGRVLAGEVDIELHCCERASEAVERANQLEPTLILQDLVMPGIDGLKLLELYRKNPTTAATPVVVLSGNDDTDRRSKSLAAGACDYLVKLPPKNELVSCIRRHVTGDRAPAAAAPPRPAAPATDSVHTLDREAVATLRQVGPPNSERFFEGLVDQFLKEADTRVNILKRAAFGRNANELKSTAHSLKGASNTMGASRLAVMCSQLEEHVERHPDCAGVLELAASVSEELQRVREAFAAELQRVM